MNQLILISAAVMVIIAIYVTFFTGKPMCSVTIYGLNKGAFVKHEKRYGGFLKKTRNKSKDKTIHWFEIKEKKLFGGKKFNWRPIAFHEFITTSRGKKHVTLAWLGGNDFRVINPEVNLFKYIPVEKNVYKRVKKKSLKFSVYTEEDQYFLADIHDELSELYKRKEDWFEKLKPYIIIGITVIGCLLLIASTSKNVLQASENNQNASSWIVGYFETKLSKSPDSKTTITTNTGGDP